MNTEQERAELLPCPFCGAGTTEIQENGRPWLGTKGWGEPVSVSVRHWCDHVDGQPSRMIERVGRDRAAAIDAWNRRAALQSQDEDIFSPTSLTGLSKDELIRQLQWALNYWMPNIADDGTPDGERAAREAYLLLGMQAPVGREEENTPTYWERVSDLQSQDREDAGMAEIVREAAQIIAAIPPEHAPDNIRWPIVDELEGFASKIDHARRVEGTNQDE